MSDRLDRQSQPLERITNQGEEGSEAGEHGRIVPRSQQFVIILTTFIPHPNNCGLQQRLIVHASERLASTTATRRSGPVRRRARSSRDRDNS